MSKSFEPTQTKQEWLAHRLKQAKNKQTAFGITPQPRPQHVPLSFAQQRLWFLEQWAPGNPTYLLSYGWRLNGPLDEQALRDALTALSERHETLRTAFPMVDGEPVQVIHPVASVPLSVQDLTTIPESSREDELRRIIHSNTRQFFDLAKSPLWRVHLVRRALQDYVFLMIFHHIITDGWSMGIVFKELNALYDAYSTGRTPSLSRLPLQYADFSIWQRQWLQGDVLNRQLSYWRKQLAEPPTSLDLPTDLARPSRQTYRGKKIAFTLPPGLTQALKTLSQQEGVTLFMTMLAAFQLLMARYSGQKDILTGTPIAGRTHTELEGMIGFFVNTLVIRLRIKGQPTFREILRQVRETCLDAYAHQDLPFEKLVEALQPVRDPSRHPLFQVMFQLFTKQTGTLDFSGMTATRENIDLEIAKFDLNCFLQEQNGSLLGRLEYNSDLFFPKTIQRLITHYQQLLQGLTANPDRPVQTVPILTDEERQQQLNEWNDSVGSFLEPQTTLLTLFETQVAQTPDAIALVFEDQHLTFSQLATRARQVASYLIHQGVIPEVRVGVYLEREVDLIVSFLAILTAGGAYVPLDPSVPSDRLRLIIGDADVAIVLTSSHLQGKLKESLAPMESSSIPKPQVIDLGKDCPPEYQKNLFCMQPDIQSQNLAYVMYTSGSTGQPKGVSIPHQAVVRLVHHPTYIPEGSQVSCLQLASPSFDAATFEIWACLIAGGKLVLPSSQLPTFEEIGAFLHKHQITMLWLTAGLFHQLVDWDINLLGPVRTLLAGGDVLSPGHVNQVTTRLPTCRLINGYGPTENTTFTCCFSIPEDGRFGETVPIGRPIAQTQVYVLDDHYQLMPVRGAGELVIAGLGLARGYHRRPGMTAEQFIPNPFSPTPGARMYRSGDIVRYRPDGNIEFLGRQDHQVKIRGYRIECGEIETVLATHPAVQEAIVLPREDNGGSKRLVAYFTVKHQPAPSPSDLRNFLEQTLPSYMIPSGFVALETFPLTQNGKVDRKKLPIEGQEILQTEESYLGPETPLEEQLVHIWEAVLGKKPIGVNDNFFNLGGESLMAVRLCSAMERALGKKVPVSLIFHAQTIKHLAKKIGARELNAPSAFMVPIQPLGSHPPVFCVLFGATFLPYLKKYLDQPLYMFINQGHDGRPALLHTVEEIAEKYIQELRTVQPQGPYYLAGYSFGGMVAFEIAQILHRQGETIALLALIDPTTKRSSSVASHEKRKLRKWLHAATVPESSSKTSTFSQVFLIPSLAARIYGAMKWRLKSLPTSSWVTLKKTLCNCYFAFGCALPQRLRRFYRDRVVKQASKTYRPQRYPGPLVLFQTKNAVERYWGPLCERVDHIYRLPGGHLEIVEEPHTEKLLEHFMECLEKAQKHQRDYKKY